ncbi:MAG: zinc ABC transporter substrate-binding protein [Myxococcaceae bacterium]|nr:zinc ABC transporter substrate-binding protein [Myxococcaceae bacterium]
MKTWLRLLMSVWLLLGGAASAKVKVVATLSDLGAITREVGGELVSVKVLARSTQDPHFVDARPSLVLDVANADLLIINGMELEAGWLPPVVTNSRNEKVQRGQPGFLDASTLVTPKEVPTQKLDRSMGDIHPGGNPHYTLDPENAVKVSKGIAERLAQVDPAHASEYAANQAKFAEELTAKVAAWKQALAPFHGTDVVTYHKSWIYFVDFAGLDEVAFVEPKPGLPPSAGHVANVLGVMKARKVPLILQEQWYPAGTSEQLARISGATLVRVPGQTPEQQRYIEHIDDLVHQVVAALAKKRG